MTTPAVDDVLGHAANLVEHHLRRLDVAEVRLWKRVWFTADGRMVQASILFRDAQRGPPLRTQVHAETLADALHRADRVRRGLTEAEDEVIE